MALNFLLLAVPVFVPSVSVDIIGICLTVMIVLSYPLAMLFGWIFFVFGSSDSSIGSMYLMLFAFSVLAYVQWFVLVPRIARFLKSKFFVKDVKINLTAKVETINALPKPESQFNLGDFQQNWYDEQKRTPVERIIENKNE